MSTQDLSKDLKIAVIGLGYVGLPLAVAFSRVWDVIGFDINTNRINALKGGVDKTREVPTAELSTASNLGFTDDPKDIAEATVYVVTVPTPIDENKRPDLTPLVKASQTVGSVLKPGDTVIYESTVYPGATEEDCVPILEQISGLALNRDFTVGYSPERINPGDQTRRLEDIVKVTSGSTPAAAEFVDALYQHIVRAGTHKAESIRVAEAAKVIENTQRDLNIALVNELSLIFSRMGLDTDAVLKAAGTKWNFLPFRPGLVGGHCIGVDPYYLTHKAQALGYTPQVILAGRRINDGMGQHVAREMVKRMSLLGINVSTARVLVMGLTFKENCPDLRNTRVVDVIAELQSFGVKVDVFDPWVDPAEAKAEYGIDMLPTLAKDDYDGAVLAVAHDAFHAGPSSHWRTALRDDAVIFDVKSQLEGPSDHILRL